MPANVVASVMKSEGRGIRGSSSAGESQSATPSRESGNGGMPFASPNTTNMWAAFILEEGVSTMGAGGVASSSSGSRPLKRTKTEDNSNNSDSSNARQVEYDLSILTKKDKSLPFGSLVQAGTLDSTLVGRKPLRNADDQVYNLTVPTVLMPSIAITKVCTSCNAAHAIAIDMSSQAYGWGRNEGMVLGSSLGEMTIVPTPRVIATDISTAALGKSHTIFLKTDGSLHALGQNKSGQCGWRESVKQSGTLKPCITASIGKSEDGAGGDTVFCKIACGEDFSIALDDQGVMYTTGSAEFGQLGNGETGEYFVTANKVRILIPIVRYSLSTMK
jgi:alpha-tubulin suppressor-like RCC1 family protein